MDKREKKLNLLIIIVSVLVPVIVAVLLFMPNKSGISGNWIGLLPHLNAVINTVTTLVLLTGFVMIRKKKIRYHKLAMSTAFFLGILFLISYITYHSTSPSTVYGDVNQDGVLGINEARQIGVMRTVYLSILVSHIILAAVVVPFVLFAFYFALTQKFEHHKKTVRFTLPVWLYVSVSGVVVYLMISPYY